MWNIALNPGHWGTRSWTKLLSTRYTCSQICKLCSLLREKQTNDMGQFHKWSRLRNCFEMRGGNAAWPKEQDTNANTIDVIEYIFQFRGGAYERECHEASVSDAGWVHAGIPDSDCVLSGANG